MEHGKWYYIYYQDDMEIRRKKILIFKKTDALQRVFINPKNGLEESYPEEWIGRSQEMSEEEIKRWEENNE